MQLLEEFQHYEHEKDVLQELNALRLELKAKKDPNDAIFNVSTLAYTGSLNYAKSNVFFPQLYYSMTLNEQLLCLELLEYLTKIFI